MSQGAGAVHLGVATRMFFGHCRYRKRSLGEVPARYWQQARVAQRRLGLFRVFRKRGRPCEVDLVLFRKNREGNLIRWQRSPLTLSLIHI